MKPCRNNRKNIVWLAMDALDAVRAADLEAHLQHCKDCRVYFDEIARVKNTLSAGAAAEPALPPTTSLHRKVLSEIKAKEFSLTSSAALSRRRDLVFNWRVVVPALGLLVLAVLIVAALTRHSENSPPSQTQTSSTQTQPGHAELLPTLANYHAAADQSLERFDDLLTQQAKKPVPPPPSFTATTLGLVNLPD